MTAPHAVVTGAASGLGAAIAQELASHGWNVTGVDLQEEELGRHLGDLAATYGVRTRSIAGDLGDAGFAASVVPTAWADAPVDGLVNAAGIYPAIGFFDLTAEDWNRVQNVNVLAPLLATQALGRLAIAAGRPAAVVNIASGAANRARPGAAHYSTSKAALVMVTKATAIELGGAGIRVNAVSPGFFRVESAVNPVTEEYADLLSGTVLPGPARPASVGAAVHFLLGEGARWIHGAVIPVDGGSSAGTTALPQHWEEQTGWQSGHRPAPHNHEETSP
ncbi:MULTISPECIES: SDR family NAD(P)-dependent oxidoreductase [unclassified Pseudarthrobacter]|uniref:SDR family NAD(P)-dependent oxidoreductase n=1 Tax=unclassified Pseudarthrobacter TaxID=2647000 RepID=UPI0036296F1D